MLEQHLSYLGHDHICSRKFSGRTWKNFSSKNSYFSDFSVENSDSSKAWKIRFWDFQSNCPRTTCRTTLIFLLLDKAMLEQHFSYLGHAHICSRKFSGRTWKNFSSKNSHFLSFWRVKIFYWKVWKMWIFWRKKFFKSS